MNIRPSHRERDVGVLEAIGVDEGVERVYRTLLAERAVTPDDLATQLRVSAETVHAALRQLRTLGLVSRLSGRTHRYTAVEPDAAIEALVRARSAELERVRTASMELSALFHAAPRTEGGGGAVQVLDGPDELGRWFVRLQHQVREEMLVLDRPPYALATTNPVEPVSLSQGVRWRAIYTPEALEVDGALDEIQGLAAAGEQGRVLPQLPMKLAVADRTIALLPLSFDLTHAQALLVRDSTLLDGLVALFEHYWRQAVPLGARGPEKEVDADDQALVTLMAAGLTDTAIARQMGWSIRTMRRRTARLFALLSVTNRFQAGVQAARRGWI